MKQIIDPISNKWREICFTPIFDLEAPGKFKIPCAIRISFFWLFHGSSWVGVLLQAA